MTEGYIKFNCNLEQREIRIPDEILRQFESSRSKLYQLGLIGMYPDGIGFGNISVKSREGHGFFITGSATGQYDRLEPRHYALVTAYDFPQNSIFCTGLTKASAESLSHAAVYESLPDVGAVVHIHHLDLWQRCLNILPTTSTEIEYGTPEMAKAIVQLISEMKSEEKVIVMGGHREGILAFGSSLEEASSEILKIHNQYSND
jgi:ribulose-5-phosphate 4-epimerase/fuculose-1-phosphate aldolase